MSDASDDYGLKISRALAAVRRMHADVRRLLQEAVGTIGKGRTPVFDGVVQDQGWTIKADCWMAMGACLFYAAKQPDDPTVVDALTVRFLDDRIKEPFLLAGQIKFQLAENQTAVQFLKAAPKGNRHLWLAYADWSEPKPGEVLVGSHPEKNVEWFKVIGVPLYTICSVDDLETLMKRVRAADVGKGGQP